MKTLKDIITRLSQSDTAEIVGYHSDRYKKRGDFVKTCWGVSFYPEEIFERDEPQDLMVKREKARDVNNHQWSDNCEGWLSLNSQGITTENYFIYKVRCYQCANLYSEYLNKVRVFYNKYKKLPTLVWTEKGLLFQEEIGVKKEEEKKPKIIIDDYMADYSYDYNYPTINSLYKTYQATKK